MNTIQITLTSFRASPLFDALLERFRIITPGSSVSTIYDAFLPLMKEDSRGMCFTIPLLYKEEGDTIYMDTEDAPLVWNSSENFPFVKIVSVSSSSATLEVNPSMFMSLLGKNLVL